MALITVLSAKGAPGCTTAVLGLTLRWPIPALLVEADVAGSAILAGYLRGELHQDHGVLPLAVTQAQTRRLQMTDLWDQTLPLAPPSHDQPAPRGPFGATSGSPGPVTNSPVQYLLPGIPHATQSAAVRSLWGELASTLQTLEDGGMDAIVDLGRLSLGEEDRHGLLARSDQIVVATGSRLPQIHATKTLAEHLRARYAPAAAEMSPLTIVVVGPGRPFDAGEIAQLCGLQLAGTLAWDPASAEVYSAGARPGRKFASAALNRSLTALTDTLRRRVGARRAHLVGTRTGGDQ
ncbi:hypothetical protein [Occultella kanbiaonis]|uniref:hypothetical protein n=1 Tax=Occultella kanbiaonis TaxID=2675754 RepID=UPI0012B96B82|nr:hypothetical protein [Occultella kanbiaonis]